MRILLAFAVFVLLCGIMAAGALYGLQRYAHSAGPLEDARIVFVAPGTGVRAMAEQLEREGIIREPYAFLAVVAIRQIGGRLQAGEYEFPARASLAGVLEKMRTGDVLRRLVTIPEGFTSFDVAAVLNTAPDMVGEVDVPAEGSVLPETYAYVRGDSREVILRGMQAAMTRTLDKAWDARAEGLPIHTKEEALVLASIIEKETGVVSERRRVAGVFVNRLKLGMRLQSDPTVIYAITKGEGKIERVLYAHLDADSPYNTYRAVGLPPGPIANPGKASIEAALNPEDHDYIYFVADGTGGHVFAKTLAEHNANVARWRAVQRGGRAAAAKAAEDAAK